MSTLSKSDLDEAKKRAIQYVEKSVYMLATFLGIDPSELSAQSVKPSWISGGPQEESYATLMRQVSILQGLKND